MQYKVISAFRDRRTGEQIDPGQALPDWLDGDDIARLIGAGCLRPIEADKPTGQTSANEPPKQPNAPADAGNGAPGLFADGGNSGDAAAASAVGQVAGSRRVRRAADTTLQ